MVAPPTDPALYDLFKRVVREASAAHPDARFEVMLTDTRPDGSTYSYGVELAPDEKDQIPWDVHDAITHVIWYPAGGPDPSSPDPVKRRGDSRFVKFHADDFSHGIGVITCFGFRGQHAVGIAGTVARNTHGFDSRNPHCMERHALPDADAVVQKVLKFLEDAYEEIADIRLSEEDAYDDSDYYDDHGCGPGDDDDIDDASRAEIELGTKMGFLNS